MGCFISSMLLQVRTHIWWVCYCNSTEGYAACGCYIPVVTHVAVTHDHLAVSHSMAASRACLECHLASHEVESNHLAMLCCSHAGPQTADRDLLSMALSPSSDDEASDSDSNTDSTASTSTSSSSSSSRKQYTVVLTKVDRASTAQLEATTAAVQALLAQYSDPFSVAIICSSSKNRLGRDALWDTVWQLVQPDSQ